MTTLMTVAEVAANLRVSPATVRRWLIARDMEGVKVGKSWRVPSSEVDRIRNGS
jgi:excisionase family DNA binding protein